ncbi:MAG TPA: MarR family transcriptional regulator [Dehalococcoidia bacterium]|nr:MarR family transcriptional regulator [Dehalococcoidia bacterium]
MNEKFEYTNATVRLWLLAKQTGDLLKMCTEKLFNEYDITTEQYDVLVSAKYLGDRVNMTDIARWLRRSTNSVSMLVDRMVKAGLVKRARDRSDRRVVYVSITGKGEHILELANPGCWEIIKEILSPLSYEDRRTFLNLFDVTNRKALQYLNPGEDIQGMMKKREDLHAELMKRLPSYAWMTVSEPKRQRGKTRKTI